MGRPCVKMKVLFAVSERGQRELPHVVKLSALHALVSTGQPQKICLSICIASVASLEVQDSLGASQSTCVSLAPHFIGLSLAVIWVFHENREPGWFLRKAKINFVTHIKSGRRCFEHKKTVCHAVLSVFRVPSLPTLSLVWWLKGGPSLNLETTQPPEKSPNASKD